MENKSGFTPIGRKCIVFPDPVKTKTAGGIELPGTVVDKQKWQTTKATLIAHGGDAFCNLSGEIPEPGDRVYVSVAAGIFHIGPDKAEYRIVWDDDIAGILTEEIGD